MKLKDKFLGTVAVERVSRYAITWAKEEVQALWRLAFILSEMREVGVSQLELFAHIQVTQ